MLENQSISDSPLITKGNVLPDIWGHLFSSHNLLSTFIFPTHLLGPDFSLYPGMPIFSDLYDFSSFSSCPNLSVLYLLFKYSVECHLLKHKGHSLLDHLIGDNKPFLWNLCIFPLLYETSFFFLMSESFLKRMTLPLTFQSPTRILHIVNNNK